ncbi:MAG: T9SS type A sorting domain-containing protein [Bacteroidia bacterium]|nr:T9SS type A sorting domain-containing protein [Bacteroidia bacterium]
MKKVFLLSLGLLLGATGFAQQTVKKCDAMKQSVLTSVKSAADVMTPAMNFAPTTSVAKAVVTKSPSSKDFTWEEGATMTTRYDNQSNAAIGNRIAAWGDGTVAYTATWASDDAFNTRGTGYNYADADFQFGNEPTERVESLRSGWPSICAYGNGELLASHADGINIWYRATKGTGAWTQLSNIPTYTWPRIATTENGTVFVICADQDTQNTLLNYVRLYKSTDGGNTWTEDPFFTALDAEYNHLIGADDYVVATNGNTIAVMFCSMTYDVFYVISEDGGATWEKKVIAAWPYGVFDWTQTAITKETDSIYWCDNSGSIAVGNDGTVHCAWGLGRWAPAPESGAGYYTFWPYTVGIVYWNSNYDNGKGGNNILPFGEADFDAEHPEWLLNGTNGVSSMMNYDRLLRMAWGDYETTGEIVLDPNFTIFGWQSEVTPGTPANHENFSVDANATYNSIGLATTPAVAVDDDNNVAIMYSFLSDARMTGAYYYRSAWINDRIDGEWREPNTETSLSMEFEHSYDEVYPTFGLANAANDYYYFGYSADDVPGLVLDAEDQTQCTDNAIYAIKVATPNNDAVEEQIEAVYNIYPNPATDHITLVSAVDTDATIIFTNLAGQTVKTLNKSLTVGNNTVNIDLENGVYFCTVNANGFNKTVKVVVK